MAFGPGALGGEPWDGSSVGGFTASMASSWFSTRCSTLLTEPLDSLYLLYVFYAEAWTYLDASAVTCTRAMACDFLCFGPSRLGTWPVIGSPLSKLELIVPAVPSMKSLNSLSLADSLLCFSSGLGTSKYARSAAGIFSDPLNSSVFLIAADSLVNDADFSGQVIAFILNSIKT